MRCLVLFILFSNFSSIGFSQTAKADSILVLIENEKDDSVRQSKRLVYIEAVRHNFEFSQPIIEAGIAQAKQSHDFYYLGHFYYMGGIMYAYVGENEVALDYFKTSLNYRVFEKDTAGIAGSYLGMSNIYKVIGDFQSAIDCALQAEQAFIFSEDYGGIARIYNSLGLIFKQQNDFHQALDYYRRGLVKAEMGNDEIVKIGLLDNIGGAYQGLKMFDSAIVYHKAALELRKLSNDLIGLGRSYGNLGLVFLNTDQLDSAFVYTNKALDYFILTKFPEGLANCYNSLGQIYNKRNDSKNAIASYKKTEEFATNGNFLPQLLQASQGLGILYEETGNYKEATKYLIQVIQLKDSLFNNEKLSQIQRQEMEVHYAQKEMADSLKLAEEENIRNLEIEKQKQINSEKFAKQKLYTYAGIGGFGLGLIITIILYRSNKRQKKYNEIIAHQKAEVEEKNKEITDSINYAKRIQEAILPPHKLIEKYLPESFILYNPKDIVAGDFYWFEHHQNLIFIAAADCTGHGVPGAMVSVVCSNALNRTVKEFNIIEPGKILDKVRELVIETFEKSETDVKDGMDISLCAFNPTTQEMKWAGANNPLWIIRNNSPLLGREPVPNLLREAGGEARGNELIELNPNRQPIGKYVGAVPFSTQNLKLQKEDQVYLFTDGFADQFGGEKGKKFKAANLKKLLIENSNASMKDTCDNLSKAFEAWKGSLEQIDDVCVIGFRL